MCGKLEKSMYGTRDASQNWEEEYSETLKEIGFSRGKASPCVFYHKDKAIRLVVHGDDFTLLGFESLTDGATRRGVNQLNGHVAARHQAQPELAHVRGVIYHQFRLGPTDAVATAAGAGGTQPSDSHTAVTG